MATLTFVLYSEDGGLQHDQELRAYQIRSHAARRGHATREKQPISSGRASRRRKPDARVPPRKRPSVDAPTVSDQSSQPTSSTPSDLESRRDDASENDASLDESTQVTMKVRERSQNDNKSSDVSPDSQMLRTLSNLTLPSLLPLVHNDLMSTEEASHMIRHVHVALIRGFLPLQVGSEHPGVSFVMGNMISDRTAFESLVYAQLVRHSIEARPFPKRMRRLAIQYHTRTVESVRKSLSDAESASSDQIIISIISLALSELLGDCRTLDIRPSNAEGRPDQGPLKTLRMLDIYGRQKTSTTAHLTALLKLVKLRGGAHSIDLSSLHQISNLELIHASRELRAPRIEFITCLTGLDIDLSLSMHTTASPCLAQLGKGFNILKRPPDADIPVCLALSLNIQRLVLYTKGLFNYLKAGNSLERLALLGEQRNFVQDGLLSTLPETKPIAYLHESNERLVYAIVHLTAIIYSYICVFPLAAAPFDLVTKRIQRLMQSRNIELEWNTMSGLYIWVLCLVAIASPCESRRAWALALLRPAIAARGLKMWKELSDLLGNFLWLPLTSDEDGKQLWDEINRKGQQETEILCPHVLYQLPDGNIVALLRGECQLSDDVGANVVA